MDYFDDKSELEISEWIITQHNNRTNTNVGQLSCEVSFERGGILGRKVNGEVQSKSYILKFNQIHATAISNWRYISPAFYLIENTASGAAAAPWWSVYDACARW